MKTPGRGRVWWTLGAQKGVGQPPYAVRDRGRWWRTLPLNGVNEPSISKATFERLQSLPHLPFGARRCLDYLNRTGKRFKDLPLWE